MKSNSVPVTVVILSTLLSTCTVFSFHCAPTQFLEYEKTGIITCTSENPFYGIYWYNSTDSANNPPFLYRDDSEGDENTYSMEGYEISEDGSMVIKNVSFCDEHFYRAVLIYDESSGQIEIRDINVIVIAKPASPYPMIDSCTSQRFCFSSLRKNKSLKCSVEDSRPAVSLQWSVQTVWNETDLFSEILITKGTKWYTSSTEIEPSRATRLSLFVCKAIHPPGMLLNNDSFILIENQAEEVLFSKHTSLKIELGFPMTLKCPLGRKHVLKWEKIYKNGTQLTIGFAFLSKGSLTKALHGYQIDQSGNLIVQQTQIKHEGQYMCIFSDGWKGGGVEFNVIMYANPEPAFPIVRGCEMNTLRYCVLRVQHGSILTCSLHRIRPVVELEFGLFTETDNDLISFSGQQFVTENNDGTFDITLSSGYLMQNEVETRLTVQCRTVGYNANLSTVFDLHFINEIEMIQTSPFMDETGPDRTFNFLWLCLPFGLLLLFVTGVVCVKSFLLKKRKSPVSHSEQVMPMLQRSHLETNKTAIFTQQLRKKYEKLYNGILPVPFLSNDKYCVNNIFVESTVELQMPHKQSEWKMLKSYKDLFALIASNPKRMLVLGEPGMGKSTLTLKIAYDWCNREETSPMNNVDILILLRLRQLRGVYSIYDSIKLLLLPLDTILTTQDIETILKDCNSVSVVLDGFDECVDQDKNAYRDIENIIKGDMLQNSQVFVCTRPSCLPKELPPQTAHVRMKGFDEYAQEQYIKKAITMESSESTKYVKDKLKENTILLDFCQIPIFFVMYAHLTTYENDVTDNFNSVTNFFRYIITCCYSHYDNKSTNESSLLSMDFKENYRTISKVAFNGLFGERPKIIWDRKELESELGIELYNTYTQIGILVEEEVLTVINKPGTSSARHIFYKTEVRFYHKLFCEWYAAHYISDLALSDSEADFLLVLHKVFDTNQEYVFRFACGINPTCADKIIKYLTVKREEDRLAILCLLEKTGGTESIKKEITRLCEKQILLSANDPRIVQRSTTQMLEIASKNKIVISNVCLRSCFKNVNLAKQHIVLTSGITLPKLGTICELEVFAEEKEFDEKDVNDIMRYCIVCGSIEILRLKYCLLPEYIKVDAAVQKSRTPAICVIWAPNLFRKYTLDNKLGFWKDKEGRHLNKTVYQEEVTSFRAMKQ